MPEVPDPDSLPPESRVTADRPGTAQHWAWADPIGMRKIDPGCVCRRDRAGDTTVLGPDGVPGFHRPFRADEWPLYDQQSPSASRNLGLTYGRLWNQQGELAATVAREGLIRALPDD